VHDVRAVVLVHGVTDKHCTSLLETVVDGLDTAVALTVNVKTDFCRQQNA